MARVKAIYWFADSGFPIASIDSTLFSHIFCGFANLDSTTNELFISQEHEDFFSQFTETVQKKNPSVKTLISIGGGGISVTGYATMASQAGSRRAFIDSSIRLARTYGFHGLDLDWEFPTNNTDMTNYGKLIDEWRAAVEAEPRSSGNEVLLLTAAVFFGPRVYGVLRYPCPSIARSLDWINLMAYDFYAPTREDDRNFTRAPAALFDRTRATGHVSGSQGINAWINDGVPANKLVLGIPFYGYAWRLQNPNSHGILAPADGSAPVPSSTTYATIDYHYIRNFIAQNRATAVFDDTYVTDYCYAGTSWICYDDTQSVKRKVNYARTHVRGYFAWHVGADYNDELSIAASQEFGGI